MFNIGLAQLLGKLYEHNSLRDIINEQHQQDAIYGSMLNNNEFSYSVELIDFRKPEIIALGSSRVLPFRDEFFSKKFAGAGRAVTQIKEAEMFLSAVIEAGNKPEVILFGIDFWWFHDSIAKRNVAARHAHSEDEFASNKLRGLLKHVVQQRLDITTIYRKLVYGVEGIDYQQNKHFHSLGLGALQNFSGLRKDGSYFYGNILTGWRESPDIAFRTTLSRIEKATDKFSHGQGINEQAWHSFLSFMIKARENNIQVVLFYPPLSNKTYEAINRETVGYQYLQSLTKRLKEVGGFFNFHNPASLSANDCEFMDGFHGGEVVYAKMLKEINKEMPLPLNKSLEQNIDFNSNHALIRINDLERSKIYQEVDFLKLGCEK